MSDEHYLTTADALVYLQTTARTLYRRLANGEIPAVRMGHQWRFRKSDLDRWIAGQDRRTAAPVAPAASPAPDPAAAMPRVLVVDDDSAVRDTLADILELSRLRIDTAADGASALEQLRAQRYDLLVTDLRMPGVDGMQVVAGAKRLRPGIKTVIITAFPSQASAIDAVNLGVDGYVTKPFQPMDVLIATARALNPGLSITQTDSSLPFSTPHEGQS
jgi:excisionase family DNA binding protein